MTSWTPPNYRYRGARTCWNVRPDPRLCLDPEEPGRRPAQHGHALRVAQARRGEYEIHGGLRPRVGIVRAHHELARAHLGGEVAHRFGREHDVVVVQLPEILRGLLLEWPVLGAGASIGKGQAALIGAPRVRGEVAAAVCGADLEPGEAIERSLEDQVRERDGRLERVADHVRQQTVALEAARQRLRGPCSSIARSRSEAFWATCKRGGSDEPGAPIFKPIRAIASGTAQCACTSTTFTRRPLTTTSRRRACAWAGAAPSSPHPTKAMPAA